jgi:acyl-CoA thioesterase-1
MTLSPTKILAPSCAANRRYAASALLGALTFPLWATLSGCGRKAAPSRAVAPGSTVLCLGDSLTSGVGASAETAYPALLAQRTGWKVINGGVSGDTSAQALARLAALLRDHPPALVIVSVGGNDFLRRQSATTARSNVRQICVDALDRGAQVLLVAIPELTLMAAAGRPSDHPMFEDIAGELKIPLHANGWSTVLADERLRSDSVHANAAGYAQFVDGLMDTLRSRGLWAGG